MSRYPGLGPLARRAARVTSFSDDNALFSDERMRSHRCLVRVTHASVGATDAMARRGDYLLHPLTGFVSGYDFVGIVERVSPAGRRRGLEAGQRVAGIVPNMGAHATAIDVPSSILVPVPDTLPSEVAATLPLDAATARRALAILGCTTGSVFIQGVSGAVGLLAAQLAKRQGLHVIGTASPSSMRLAEEHGAVVLDYRSPDWIMQMLETQGRVAGVIDHTGSTAIRELVEPGGRIVRTAFGGPPGSQKSATAIGFARTLLRRRLRPAEAICSVPMHVAMRTNEYRRELASLLELVANGDLRPLTPTLYSTEEFGIALQTAQRPDPGHKAVLDLSR